MTQTAFSRRSVLLGSAAALAAGPALAAAATPSARLKALLAASDEAELKRSPLGALFRGDPRYAGQIGDLYADSYDAAGKRLAQKGVFKETHADGWWVFKIVGLDQLKDF